MKTYFFRKALLILSISLFWTCSSGPTACFDFHNLDNTSGTYYTGDKIKFSLCAIDGKSYLWEFGDLGGLNNVSSEVSPTHIYYKAGVYSVKLTVKSKKGDTDIKTETITIVDKIVPVYISSISPESGPSGTTVTIYGTGFNSTASRNTVEFSTTTATVTAASSTSLTVVVPTMSTGSKTVYVTNDDTFESDSYSSFNITSTGTPPPTSSTGDALFWTATDFGKGAISIYVGGTYRGQITSYVTNGVTPSCGASGFVTVNLPVGTYTWRAEAGTMYWPASGSGSLTVTSGGCYKMQLTN